MKEIPLSRGFVAVVDDDDADLADLRWRANIGPHPSAKPYAVRQWGPRGASSHEYMHRAIAERAYGPGGKRHVDHINGDTLDNRRANLRWLDRALNQRNIAGPYANNKSGALGIYKRTETRWEATIGVNNVPMYLGSFKTKAEAIAARLKAEKELWGIQPRREEAHK